MNVRSDEEVKHASITIEAGDSVKGVCEYTGNLTSL